MIFSEDALKQKHAFITGASSGIGYATALVLAQMGADANILIHRAELMRDVERQKLVDKAEEKFGFISLLNTIAFLLTDAAENIVGDSVKISSRSVMR